MQNTTPIKINGRNIDRTKTRVSVVTSLGGNFVDITEDVSAINYTQDQAKEFGYNLGLYASHFAVGGIVVSGSLRLSDGGVAKLDGMAKGLQGMNLLDLGQGGNDITIVVEYSMNDTSAPQLDQVRMAHFTSYPRGVDKGTLINERELPFIAAQLITE